MPMSSHPQLARLLEVMRALRDPQTGCPWDQQQTFASIVPFTIEEAYEVADAIENGSMDDIKDELGDLLFQVVFYTQLAKEQGEFDFEAVAQNVADKLIRRHPHVFASTHFSSIADMKENWEAVKAQERASRGDDKDTSVVANIPAGMAPILKAIKLQKRCAKVGFDWPDAAPVLDKIREEIDEVEQELEREQQNPDAVAEEIGDLMFAVINLARHLDVEPEAALRLANKKFEQRFRGVEKALADINLQPQDATLSQMEHLWQQVKRQKG